jgi:hypothetical protein
MTFGRSTVRIALVCGLWSGLDARAAEAQCTYSVSPTTVSAPSTGLNSSIGVTTGSSCAWTPTSTVAWITITSGGMSGLGSFSFTVAANGTGVPRTGTIIVGGKVVTVNQSTGSCTYSVTPTTVAAPMTGLNSSISVVTGSGCTWTATSPVAWITVTSGGMSGLGSVNFTVGATTTPRTGTFTVAGQTVTINQGTTEPPAPPANLRIIAIVM